MKSAFVLSLAGLVVAAPANIVTRGLFGNATFGGLASTIAQSVENPGLTADRIQVVTALAAGQTALKNIATQANGQQNNQVLSFAAQGTQGLSSAASAVSRIGQALITGATASIGDQTDVAVGIKQALDAVSCMDAGGNGDLNNAIQAATGPLKKLESAGEGVIAAQGHSFADLGLPDDFADEPANCTTTA